MPSRISNAILNSFGADCVRVFCPNTPRAMFQHIGELGGVKVIEVDCEDTYQQAMNASRAQEDTVYVFTFDYPAPREITTAAKKLDLKSLFSEVELEELFDFWEE